MVAGHLRLLEASYQEHVSQLILTTIAMQGWSCTSFSASDCIDLVVQDDVPRNVAEYCLAALSVPELERTCVTSIVAFEKACGLCFA